MTAKTLDSFLSVSDVLSSERADNGTILLQIGDCLLSEVDQNQAEFYSVSGIISRPPNPQSVDKPSAEVISVKYGDRSLCIAGRDVVGQDIAGNLNEGEMCLYGAGPTGEGQGRILFKDDGSTSSIAIYTTAGNVPGGEAVVLNLSSERKIQMAAGSNGAISLDETGLTIIVGDSGLMLKPDGTIVLIGKTLQAGCQSIMLGLGASAASPALHGMSGPAGVPSTSVFVGA